VLRFFSSFFSLFPQLWSALTSKRSTVRYPYEPLVMPPGYRGRLAFVPTRCKGCGLCVRDCPAAALALVRESKQKFKIIYYPNRCAFCGQCELVCHADALRLTNDYVEAAFDAAGFKITLIDHNEEEEETGASS
jgi:formate hydrogenlyase subunit 6/NADH:ubiquinone oxidoreductase subunit I